VEFYHLEQKMQRAMSFEYLDHTADVAVRLHGRDLEALLGAGTRALRHIIAGEESPSMDGVRERTRLCLESEDPESLLVDYLNELVFLFDARRLLPCDIEVVALARGPPHRLEADLVFERFDPARHTVKTEVKAATFHGIAVREEPEGLVVDVVFDL
jgi:SHS2 domain-containing protein